MMDCKPRRKAVLFTAAITVILANSLACKEIYISRLKGRDTDYCGNSLDNQCNTLSYAVNNIAKDGDTLFLYGGHESRIIYKLQSPLHINVSLTIKKQFNFSNPIITTDDDNFTSAFIFQHTSEKMLILEIVSIDIYNTNVFRIKKGNVTLLINNCTINSPRNDVEKINSSSEKATFSYASLQITNTNVNCNNSYLVSDDQQGTDFESIIINNSVFTGCSIFLNSTSNHTQLQLEIEDTVFQGNVNNSVVHINRYSNITLCNVRFFDNIGVGDVESLFDVTSPDAQHQNSSIFFHNITFQNNQNTGFLFLVRKMHVKGTFLVYQNNTNSNGTFLDNSTGNIDNVTCAGNKLFGYCIYTYRSNCSFGRTTIINNHFAKCGFRINSSSVSIDSIVVKDTVFADKHHSAYFVDSYSSVTSLDIENVTVTHADAVGLRLGNLTIGSLTVKNNLMHQAFLQLGGSLRIMSGSFHNNNSSLSTLIGSVNAALFDIRAISFTNNLIGDKLFHVENVIEINFQHIHVSNNTMNGIFHILKGNLFIDGAIIKNNTARKHGKALSFTDEAGDNRISHNVNINNFHAHFDGFTGLYQSDNYFELDIRTSNLSIQNSSVSVQDVYVPSIKLMKLVFKTTHPNIHPQISVVCPTNYDIVTIPLVKVATIDYVVDCQRCKKDTYSLLRGQLELKDVINNSFIDTTWIIPHNIKAIFSTERSKSLQCFPCPSGGDCLNGTRSQGNYYGYKTNKTNLEFISCPTQYCCSKHGKECTSYDTCSQNRKGILCGRCQDGFYESLFSPNCIESKKCTKEKQSIFWILFILSAVVLTFIVCFFKDILTILRYSLDRVRRIRQHKDMIYNTGNSKTVFVIQSENTKEDFKLNSWMTGRKDCAKQEHPLQTLYFKGVPFKNECYNPCNEQPYTLSGLVQILVTFFQIDALTNITLEGYSKIKYEVLSDIFNLEILLYEADSLCPFQSIGAVGKLMFRKILLFLAMIIVITITLLVALLLNQFKILFIDKLCRKSRHQELFMELTHLPIRYKMALAYLKIIMFAYKNIAFVSITLMSCPYINNDPVLYIDGTIKCYREYWQIFNYMFFAFWIFPFPLVLPFLYDMMKKEVINLWNFLFCLTVPLATPYWYYKEINRKSKYLEQLEDDDLTRDGMDSNFEREIRRHLYAIFEEPYREQSSLYWWVTMGLYERLLVASLSTLLIDPTKRMCAISIVIVIFLWLHFHLKPYKKEMSFLTMLDVTSYICLCFHSTINLFRAVVYNLDISPQNKSVRNVLNIFGIFGYAMTPLTLFLVYFLCKSVLSVHQEFTGKKKN